MLDDLTKEIKAQLYERVKSPLFGAFALAWVGWNYRGLLAAISDMPYKDRMGYLDSLYPTSTEWLWHCLGGPLLTAVGLLLIYPWPARWMYSYWAWQQKELKKVQQRIEDETPLTQEEAKVLRKASIVQITELESQNADIRQLNRELQERLRESASEQSRLAKERDQFQEAAKRAQEQLTPYLARVVQAGPGLQEVLANSPVPVGYPGSGNAINPLSNPIASQSPIRRQAEESAVKLLMALGGTERGTIEQIAISAGLDVGEANRGLDRLIKQALVAKQGDLWALSPKGKELNSSLAPLR